MRISFDSSLLRFAVVGALGFLVDALILLALAGLLGMGAFGARLISILLAITVTWACHRRFTFRTRGQRRFLEWMRFVAVNGAGATTNYAIYAGLLFGIDGLSPLVALTIASAVALAVNYNGAKWFAFRA